MNYYDSREHFGGYDMLLRFYGAARNKNMMLSYPNLYLQLQTVIVWETALSYFHRNDVHGHTLFFTSNR